MKTLLELFRYTTAETGCYALTDGGLIGLERASGYRVVCQSGWLSISVPGSHGRQGQDIELSPGLALTIEHSGLILIEAVGNARLALIALRPAQFTSVFGRRVIINGISKVTAMKPAASS